MTGPKEKRKQKKERNEWRSDREYHRIEEKFIKTGDIRYAALAIGYWHSTKSYPDYPPQWALDACTALRAKAEVGIEAVINKTQGKRVDPKDYERIDRVARAHLSGSAASPTQLFSGLLDEEGLDGDPFDAALRRLLKYYGPTNLKGDGGVENKHVSRLAREDALAQGFGRTFGEF